MTKTRWQMIRLKIFSVVLIGFFFVNMAVIIYLDSYYAANLPKEPSATAGRVHPLFVHHGTLVYLNESEKRLWHTISASFLVTGLGAGFAGYLNCKYSIFENPLDRFLRR